MAAKTKPKTPKKVTKVKSMQDAKNKIYSRIKKGENFSEIVKTKFDINGSTVKNGLNLKF
ncbi:MULTISPECIES: hypothetical protein [Nitrosopumilus]|uniref:hypothetical protein n=1 Tax=Nitrosopumilus TaxID=338191 RepID=UPI00035F1D58|nr:MULTISPECIES: hypothetical protein [Nitrosopumilus]